MDTTPPTRAELEAVAARLQLAIDEPDLIPFEQGALAVCDALDLIKRMPGGLDAALLRLFLDTSTAIYTAPR